MHLRQGPHLQQQLQQIIPQEIMAQPYCMFRTEWIIIPRLLLRRFQLTLTVSGSSWHMGPICSKSILAVKGKKDKYVFKGYGILLRCPSRIALKKTQWLKVTCYAVTSAPEEVQCRFFFLHPGTRDAERVDPVFVGKRRCCILKIDFNLAWSGPVGQRPSTQNALCDPSADKLRN